MQSKRHDNTHLTLDERKIIQTGIENGSTKADMARVIKKDETTVAKEIRRHREFKPRNTFNKPVMCGRAENCPKYKTCFAPCPLYEEPKCNRRDKSPGACNGCGKGKSCRYDKYFYNAIRADKTYRNDLSDYRSGFNLTTKERDFIAGIIAPLLAKGQSLHQILCNHPEIRQCERTLYTYIENGVFKDFNVDNFSLKEKVGRKLSAKYKKRREPANYEGRKYSDYLQFRVEHPYTPVVEMDTLYNSQAGPYLQTFMFEKTPFMIGFLHKEKTSQSMAGAFDLLQERLGNELFSQLFSLILTDRGTEFEKYKLFELDKNLNSRLSIYYCDPMQSSQKPHVENNHNYVRDIIPNKYPMENLGQSDIDLMFSHINSIPRRSLGGKTPFELFGFIYGEETAKLLNITMIKRDEVTLKPSLIFGK